MQEMLKVSVFELIHDSAHFHNQPVFKFTKFILIAKRCLLMQVDQYNGRKRVVVVVFV